MPESARESCKAPVMVIQPYLHSCTILVCLHVTLLDSGPAKPEHMRLDVQHACSRTFIVGHIWMLQIVKYRITAIFELSEI